MQFEYDPDISVILPDDCRRMIVEHGRRAAEAFHHGRIEEGKAFGLLSGTAGQREIVVRECCVLKHNVRSNPPYREHMDRVMGEHAVPSRTPMAQRGWVADPAELFARIKEFRRKGHLLLGTYHVHRVGWEHDRLRDTPTKLDTVLAADSGLLMFIVSMVDPARPIIRAFYEGAPDKEIPIKQPEIIHS